ncbi:hypothetical protein [Pyxidicoccus xibeiensis]|uniref:hypothetical protein n=1 Tax=Pyxidicoccus xibeiensis TaxID=2906759 RepID=UPI0020A74F3B|nr:hypothetical protein [Pyxidicoccus xibeiensis]MCP3136729.1 hypothetical protein [Pyxidicoccus xibeiensis]
MRVAEAFLTRQGQVQALWPYESSYDVHHFLFEADARRLAALVDALRAFERTAEVATLVDYLARERPDFDRALDEVRWHVPASELEALMREDGDARAAWLDAREGTGWVRAHRYQQLRFGVRRFRALVEREAARELIHSEAEVLWRLVRESPAPGAIVQTARERAREGHSHEVFGLCLQTALLPEADDLGGGVLFSLDIGPGDPGPYPLPRTLVSEVFRASALLSDGRHEELGAITWGVGEDLEQVARELRLSGGQYASTELADALARLGARGACAVSFTALRRDAEG